MELIPITEIELVNTIATLKTKKSAGYGSISNIVLKHCANAISKPYTYICNCSLFYGIFPDRCKYAFVVPIYKKGHKFDRSKYRPVSVLLSLSKPLEILMYNRLHQHLQSNKIIVAEQFGFRNGIKIENAIFSLTDTILDSLNNKQLMTGIFL